MIRRLGLIGDLHGEHERLGRVLDWFAGQRVDAVVCTGDLADGRGCLNTCCQLLEAAGVLTVAGNHDRWLLQNRVRHLADAHQPETLSDASRAYLEALPRTRSLQTIVGPLLLCHGVGDNDLGKVWPGTARSRVIRSKDMDTLLAAGSFRWIVNGHMHFRVLIDFVDLLMVNAGTLKGDHAGVSVLDFAAGAAVSWRVSDDAAPMLALEQALAPDAARRIWRDTQAFDGNWDPVLL